MRLLIHSALPLQAFLAAYTVIWDGTVHGLVQQFFLVEDWSVECSRSIVEMASGKDKGGPELEDVPAASFQSAVCELFGLSATYDEGSEKVVDKTATVWKRCATFVAYASGNTFNMLAHRRIHHPSVSIDGARRRELCRKGHLLLPAAFKMATQ